MLPIINISESLEKPELFNLNVVDSILLAYLAFAIVPINFKSD